MTHHSPVPRLLTDELVFPESPRWRDGQLWISDVHGYALVTVSDDGSVHRLCQVPGRPAGSGFLPDGRLLLATALDRVLSVWDGADLKPVADLACLTSGPLNDMVVDPTGRAWVGDTGFNLMTEHPRPGRIITFSLDDGPRVAAEDVMFPNGMVLTPDGRELVVNESVAGRASVFSVAADGSLNRARTLVDLGSMPDGMCLDAEGAVWIPLLRGGRFVRVSATGEVLDSIDAEGRLPVSCALGGPSRQWLYLCSADSTMADLAQGRSRGFVHCLPAPVPGAGLP
ncbi:SMP-30/gluconolactonase/LRE family protein [Streptomyces sp. NPDC052207]|uniref:SMP-30/gluconolactonase/LRE family protein n=1 Tax=Streptomyces sp. NPDC052207 TaxID=3155418 RepID=UPI003438A5DF